MLFFFFKKINKARTTKMGIVPQLVWHWVESFNFHIKGTLGKSVNLHKARSAALFSLSACILWKKESGKVWLEKLVRLCVCVCVCVWVWVRETDIHINESHPKAISSSRNDVLSKKKGLIARSKVLTRSWMLGCRGVRKSCLDGGILALPRVRV